MRAEAKLVSQCGYTAPPPRPRGQQFFKRLSAAMLHWQVGPVKVIGRENLNAPGPSITIANHSNYVDSHVYPTLFEEPVRYMMDSRVFSYCRGMIGVLFSRGGVYAVDITQKGKGGPAVEASIRMMLEGQRLMLFPEGICTVDGTMKKLQKGFLRIVRAYAKQKGNPGYIIPSYMHYHRRPGKWILYLPYPVQYFLMFLGAPFFYRRGMTVVIGKPISTDELPESEEEALLMFKECLIALKAQALGYAEKRRAVSG